MILWLIGLLAIGSLVGWTIVRMRHAERQRRAVAQLLEIGGRLHYEDLFEQLDQGLDDTLPRSPDASREDPGKVSLGRPFGISFIEFRQEDGRLLPVKSQHVTDADLAALHQLPGLRWLALDGRQLSDKGLESLRALSKLETLWLGQLGNHDAWMIHLAGMDNLKRLFLPYSHVTDEGLKHLAGLQQLESLDLSGTHVTDAGLSSLRGLANLRHLALPDTLVTDAGGKHLNGLARLESLDLSGIQLTDAGMSFLKGLGNLKTLHLPYTQITAAGLAEVRGLTRLEELNVAGTDVSDAALADLEKLERLARLSLEGTRVTDAGLPHLARLTRLESLVLSATQVSDAGLVHLEPLTALETLRVSETDCTLSGVIHLLTVLQGRRIGDALDAVASTQRDADGQLTSLDLSGIRVTDSALAHLAEIGSLEWLLLGGTEVTDAGLLHLKGLPRLTLLDLAGTRVSDAGLQQLLALANLRTLHLGDTRVSDQGVQQFEAAFPGGIRVYTVGFTRRHASGFGAGSVDSQFRGYSVVRQLKAVPGLRFLPIRLRVPPGRRIALTYKNADINMQHNFVLVQSDRLEAIGEASMQLAADPTAMARHYVPEDPGVLCHSPILSPGDQCTVYFNSPATSGAYPFICTFPGHWKAMRGVLYVAGADEDVPESIELLQPARKFVRMWMMHDLAEEAADLTGRSFERGREMFRVAGCNKCHVIAGEGAKLGPDLTQVSQRYKGAKLLEQILEPSTEINKQYQTYVLNTARGETITGLIIQEDADAYHLLPNPLQPEDIRIVKKTELESIEASRVSTMPRGLLMTLEKDEILDLLAYLEAGGQ